ncbi:MAG: methyltransferase domain-containing protein [Acidimicrobiia bacterium]
METPVRPGYRPCRRRRSRRLTGAAVVSRDLGDWQTPPELSASVLNLLARRGIKWSRVLEPTCGTGSFLMAALRAYPEPDEVIGIDVQARHLAEAREALGNPTTQVQLLQRDIFSTDLGRDLDWRTDGPMLIVGNPPWVTNAELGSLGSNNLPRKSNVKGLTGLDAVTGSANFDIAEYITLKLMNELSSERPTIALLVKTIVARNVLRHSKEMGWPIESACIYRFNAHRAFGAAVDACLLVMECGGSDVIREIPVYASLETDEPSHVMGFSNGDLVADIHSYRLARRMDGASPLTWRQGVKHDAAPVMELESTPSGLLQNKLGEVVDVEADFVFPLVKGTQLNRGDTHDTPRWVIVPQRRLSDNTLWLQHKAPKLWDYLTSHRDVFDGRRSSIYRGKPRFVIFGVGDYTFTDFKIAVSGLHKEPRFRLLGPIAGKPVVLDDTCYILPCHDRDQADLLLQILNGPDVRHLLEALMFPDSKRPITKRLLQRIDLGAALDCAGYLTARPDTVDRLKERIRVRDETEASRGQLALHMD